MYSFFLVWLILLFTISFRFNHVVACLNYCKIVTLCDDSTICLPILLLIGILVYYQFGSLWIRLLWAFFKKSFWETMLYFLSKYPDGTRIIGLLYVNHVRNFQTAFLTCITLISNVQDIQSLHSLGNSWCFQSFWIGRPHLCI